MLKYSLQHHFCLAVLLIVALATLLAAEEADDLGEENRAPKIAEVIELIDSLPAWPLVSPLADNPNLEIAKTWEEANKITQICLKIAEHETDIIRGAVEKISARHDHASHRNLFWLNRFLFATPATVSRDSPHFPILLAGAWYVHQPGGRSGKEESEITEFSIRWPWLLDKKDNLKFGVQKGAIITYSGPPYPALEVFDYCEKNFGRRKLKSVE